MKWTAAELSDKIEWEGGLTDAVHYGIYPNQVPEEVREQWLAVCQLVTTLDELEQDILETLADLIDAADVS